MSTSRTAKFFSGTSGLALPLPKRSFPPEYQHMSRLEYYASLFNSIEINSSFYKLPQAATVRKWGGSVQPGFQFTFKLWKLITHNKGLAFEEGDIEQFFERINEIGDKKGCLLVQFPPSIGVANAAQFKRLLTCLAQANTGQPWKVAVEFRNRSWYQEDIYELLIETNTGMVLHDLPASSITQFDSPIPFVYLRFHGPNGGYRGTYTDEFLYEYSHYISDWMADEKDVYVYFNNTMGEAVKNLLSLNDFVAQQGLT